MRRWRSRRSAGLVLLLCGAILLIPGPAVAVHGGSHTQVTIRMQDYQYDVNDSFRNDDRPIEIDIPRGRPIRWHNDEDPNALLPLDKRHNVILQFRSSPAQGPLVANPRVDHVPDPRFETVPGSPPPGTASWCPALNPGASCTYPQNFDQRNPSTWIPRGRYYLTCTIAGAVGGVAVESHSMLMRVIVNVW